MARNKKISDEGLELDGQKMSFERGKGAALWVADEGKARALQQKYPRDIAVTLDQQYTWHANNENGNGTRMDNIHHYTFGPMTSPAAAEFWQRYEAKKKEKANEKKKAPRLQGRGKTNRKTAGRQPGKGKRDPGGLQSKRIRRRETEEPAAA